MLAAFRTSARRDVEISLAHPEPFTHGVKRTFAEKLTSAKCERYFNVTIVTGVWPISKFAPALIYRNAR
jgi:hypothetical protein